jgi:hypothetical protein
MIVRGSRGMLNTKTGGGAEIGDTTVKHQRLIKKTRNASTTHPFAKIWILECEAHGHRYGSNSCDAHIRQCPLCHPRAAPSEPI